jgi:hypothetical protein
MKFTLALFAVLALASTSQAALTWAGVVQSAAAAVVDSGNGPRVEGCPESAERAALMKCVADNMSYAVTTPQFPADLELTETFDLSVNDASGDCYLTVEVDAASGKTVAGHWQCD